MSMKVLWAGAMLFGGWLWFYLFGRQLCFNFLIAYPLIKRMQKTAPELIAVGANRYTTVSVVVNLLVCGGLAAVVFIFCPLYLKLSFVVGALIAAAMVIPKMKVTNREMYDIFCASYYRFVPDDELRTAMYNKKPSQMKMRLHVMELDIDCIPKFTD